MNYKCKCGSMDFFTEPQGNNIGLYCSMCGKWKKWLGKDEALAFQHNQAGKKQKQLEKRIIKVTATYTLDDKNIILPITSKETVKQIVEADMESYFNDDKCSLDVEVEVIDE